MKTILVVDDEAKIRDVVASYLTKEGFRTLEAGTGHEALRIVQNETVDFRHFGSHASGYGGRMGVPIHSSN